mmetsp:Transcript_9213/g.29289  ORF Transcript_9213/g.29289 Transcript_9213/m.29289 type:complete len:218 (+) Transcript_9213:2289-2942(+)
MWCPTTSDLSMPNEAMAAWFTSRIRESTSMMKAGTPSSCVSVLRAAYVTSDIRMLSRARTLTITKSSPSRNMKIAPIITQVLVSRCRSSWTSRTAARTALKSSSYVLLSSSSTLPVSEESAVLLSDSGMGIVSSRLTFLRAAIASIFPSYDFRYALYSSSTRLSLSHLRRVCWYWLLNLRKAFRAGTVGSSAICLRYSSGRSMVPCESSSMACHVDA